MTVMSTVDVCLLCAHVSACADVGEQKPLDVWREERGNHHTSPWMCGGKREGGVRRKRKRRNAGATRQGRKPEPHLGCGE